MNDQLPNLEETTLGVFLHDIGKFLQRAHGSSSRLSQSVQALESQILPPAGRGEYSHKHALWTEEFFQWLERENLSFPAGLNRARVRNVAVYHHNPDSPLAWLCAEADRLASGMERKPRDEEAERQQDSHAWDAFIRTPLQSPFAQVHLGLGEPPASQIPLAQLTPGDDLLPHPKVDTTAYQQQYGKLLSSFQKEFGRACGLQSPALFLEAVHSLSERFLFAVPSSTIDQPDISLHDHSRVAAAVAAALYRWHEHDGSLNNVARIRDRSLPKFRFLAGDLSGIQSTLFLLANQQVRGVNKILRARSFLMGMLLEGAALLLLRRLRLTLLSVLQDAGGRFVLLVPAIPEVEANFQNSRRVIEGWMLKRYLGELALNLALAPPFAPQELLRKNFPPLLAALGEAVDRAKQQPFASCLPETGPVHHEADYAHGACSACGVRPALPLGGAPDGEQPRRCAVCQDEFQLGGALPKMAAISWTAAAAGEMSAEFFGQLWLRWHDAEWLDRLASTGPRLDDCISAARVYQGRLTPDGALALRHFSSYVPRLAVQESGKAAYRHLGEEAREVEAGELKTFEHLALDALEPSSNGELLGENHLLVLKADVDRLGFIFGFGLPDATLSRYAALSRMLDFFFTGYLYRLLEEKFPSTYTVYAGGDDLLLIGPWRQTLDAALTVRQRFEEWTGHNPNITLSAGLELMKVNHPLNRVARRAEERLEAAKGSGEKGRNRVCAMDRIPLSWEDFARQLSEAEDLHRYLQAGMLSQAFLYRVLYFAGQRRRAEDAKKPELAAANWRAQWGYQLARNILHNKNLSASPEEKEELARKLNGLLGLDQSLKIAGEYVSPRTAISVALYRNRTFSNRS